MEVLVLAVVLENGKVIFKNFQWNWKYNGTTLFKAIGWAIYVRNAFCTAFIFDKMIFLACMQNKVLFFIKNNHSGPYLGAKRNNLNQARKAQLKWIGKRGIYY